jgi:hypothetical protein
VAQCDDSDSDDKSDSGDDGEHKNMGDHSAANTPSVPTKGPATLELAGATDGVTTVKSEVLGPWLEAGRHRPAEQRGAERATVRGRGWA